MTTLDSIPITTAGPMTTRPARLLALALAAAVVAGLSAWLAGESTYRHFVPPTKVVVVMGGKLNISSFPDRVRADLKNAALHYGILGGCLGLAMGLAGGLSRKSVRAGLTSALLGSILGGAGAAGASAALLPIYYHKLDVAQEELSHDLVLPFLMHAGIAASLGAISGLAFGLGLGGRRPASLGSIGGLFGGLVGVVIFEIAGALLFPEAKTSEPVALQAGARLLASLAISLGVGTLVVASLLESKRKPSVA